MKPLHCLVRLTCIALASTYALNGIAPTHADSTATSTPTPATLQGLGIVPSNSPMAGPPVYTQQQLVEHAQRRDAGRVLAEQGRAANTISITPNDQPGSYSGLSRAVGVGAYPEPNHSPYANYCGPGQVLISNWVAPSNVPTIDTLATQEQTSQSNGTYVSNMVNPINNDANTGSFYLSAGGAASQADFNDDIAGDIYYGGRPAITQLNLYGTYNNQQIYLNGWSPKITFPHIITIYGFNFSNPPSAGDNYYYMETSGTYAGTTATGTNTYGANKLWALVQGSNVQLW